MCQDWGGLTGLSVVKDAPDRFSNLVIMNTGIPSPVFDFRNEENGRKSQSAGQTVVGVIFWLSNPKWEKLIFFSISFSHSVCGSYSICLWELIFLSENCLNILLAPAVWREKS